MNYRLLIINMGSTSTKVGVYLDDSPVWTHTITHRRKISRAICISWISMSTGWVLLRRFWPKKENAWKNSMLS